MGFTEGGPMMTLQNPIWLVLAIPTLTAWWIWSRASLFLRYLRLTILLLILLAICGPSIRFPSREGALIVIVDRSLSMPQTSDALQKEAIDHVQRAMSGADQLGVVSFGEHAAIERPPQAGAFGGFTADTVRDSSNLAEAIEKALSMIPPEAPGKILLLSDGRWTGRDPGAAAAKAAARGVAIDYRSMKRQTANDLAISQIDAPVSVTPGEAFMITAWIQSPAQQEIAYELRRGSQVIAAGKSQVGLGQTRLTFRDAAGDGGAQSYTLRIAGADASGDPLPENNLAKALVGVAGPRPLLVVSTSRESGLARLIASGGIKVVVELPESIDWSLEELAKYSGVVIENVPADKIKNRPMETIAAWLTETGGGLMMTGGKQAYGPGGYFKSPLDPLLPVSMELRQEHRKFALAIVVAMDRSGSMAVTAGGGRTKMDLANIAAVQALDLLSPMDEFGVVAVDSASHIIADLKPIENPAKVRQDILKIDSGGGGIFIFEALSTSADMLLKARAGTRHILLFADAADSEEPGKYRELLTQCEQAGITVSVIGLGKPTDSDAELLRDIAKRGNGQIFFTENADELPRLFAQDTIIVARSMFLDEPAPIEFTGGMVALTGKQFTDLQSIGGYNLCYLRPQANLAAVSNDENKSPIVASWQAGQGRVLCYLGEADGEFSGAMASWKNAGDFFTSLARWTAGDVSTLPGGALITQEVRDGVSRIKLELDPARDPQAFSFDDLPNITTLRGVPGRAPSVEKGVMHWTSADTLELEIPLRGNETALSTVESSGIPRTTLAPVTLPYSPEFKPMNGQDAIAALARLAKATGGKERIELSGVWKDLPRRPRMIEITPWLLLAALTLLIAEVLERRTGLLTAIRPFSLRRTDATIVKVESQSTRPSRENLISKPEVAQTEEKKDESTPIAIVEALRQARKRSRK
jgi:riboflavin biosynthesis pyrimidine reductase